MVWSYTNNYSMSYRFQSSSTRVEASGSMQASASGTRPVSGTLRSGESLQIIPDDTDFNLTGSGSFMRSPGFWSDVDYYPQVVTAHDNRIGPVSVRKGGPDADGKCRWSGQNIGGNTPAAPRDAIIFTDGTNSIDFPALTPNYPGEGTFTQDDVVINPGGVVVTNVSSLAGRISATYSYHRTASRTNATLESSAEYSWTIEFRIVRPSP